MDKGGEVYLPFPTGLVSLHGGHTILHFLEGGVKNAVSASGSIDQLLRSSMNCPPPPPTYPVPFPTVSTFSLIFTDVSVIFAKAEFILESWLLAALSHLPQGPTPFFS